jgi:PTH1 family peptidyl-tRNA hydrolase
MTNSGWLVVGLGNPGPTYAAHRHNVGHMVVDLLADRMGARFRPHPRGRAEVVEGRLGPLPGTRVVLAKARTYMNESGGPVASLLAFYKLTADRLVVVHDELDIPLGAVRLKFGGGDGGHRGLRSIRQSLGTADFYRVRVGIGRPPGRQDPADFVLSPFSSTERKELPFLVDRAADAVETLVLQGLEVAQNTYHAQRA